MRVTAIVLLTIVLMTAATDAALYAARGWEGTFSFLILRQSRRYPIIALMIGVLLGHLFWPQPEPPDDSDNHASR